MKLAICASALSAFFLLTVVTASAAESEMIFKFSSSVWPAAIAEFQSQMRDARAKVSAWWGNSYEGPIAIDVRDDQGASMALVPAWRGERGQILFDAKTVNNGRAATHHEMVHVYAPNANRLLAEGLATYAHDLLGGKPAYPNFGRPIDTIAAKYATKDLILKLERASTPSPLEPINENGYALAGSFVRFLIEKHGMEKFRTLYDLTPSMRMKRDAGAIERWQAIYGQPLDALTDAWLAAIK